MPQLRLVSCLFRSWKTYLARTPSCTAHGSRTCGVRSAMNTVSTQPSSVCSSRTSVRVHTCRGTSSLAYPACVNTSAAAIKRDAPRESCSRSQHSALRSPSLQCTQMTFTLWCGLPQPDCSQDHGTSEGHLPAQVYRVCGGWHPTGGAWVLHGCCMGVAWECLKRATVVELSQLDSQGARLVPHESYVSSLAGMREEVASWVDATRQEV